MSVLFNPKKFDPESYDPKTKAVLKATIDFFEQKGKRKLKEDGTYGANGEKYYIGNGNVAKMVSTFGKMGDSGKYVFFVANYLKDQYQCVQNVINSQSYVSEYVLRDYPITDNEILHQGDEAWDAALNTVNIGKFNLGGASIGIATHAFYEALNHASHRELYGMFVTDFGHVRRMFIDAYSRLVAMKLFAYRTSDYLRVASAEDRRYLLYNPVMKMKVTTQGEEVIDLLWDVIAARGFEKDLFFEMATRDIRALPKLEGTVHVNIALIVKFMQNYFFNPGTFPEVGVIDQPGNDDFLFEQGPTKGLGGIQFHDYNLAYGSVNLPNIEVFKSQIELFKQFLITSISDPAAAARQARDIDFLLTMGEIFTLVAYGQLIIEYAQTSDELNDDLLDMIFDFMVRDFSKFALQIYSKTSSSEAQMEICLEMIRKPVKDLERYDRVWQEHVFALKDQYAMND